MKIKLGCNPLCWMNTDFPQMEGQVSVDQCLSEIAMIGYEGVEMEDPFLKVIEQLPFWLQKLQLQCIGKWHSTRLLECSLEDEMERLDKHCEMLEALGARVVNLAECTKAVHQDKNAPLSLRPKLKTMAEWKTLCTGLEILADRIEQRGMVSAYHHHMGTVIQSSKDIDCLMQETQTLGLLLDTGHLLFSQADPMYILEKYLPRIAHVHCKSVRPEILNEKIQQDSSFFEAVLAGIFTVPGDQNDIVDYQKVIEMLNSCDYKGWLVVEAEQNPSTADPFTYAHLGYETLYLTLQNSLRQEANL